MGIFSDTWSRSVVLLGDRQRKLFTDQILRWYRGFHRSLPWRGVRDPYKIWVSEMILQQTRVAQGLPYYERILAAYPTLADFAAADEAHILRLWQGMGYYRRAQYMHATAKQLVSEYKGIFPSDPKALQRLKGIGPYTAAAIASLAFDVAVPVLDGNVFRVIARVFGQSDDIHKPATRTKFDALLKQLIDPKKPGQFNQAMMELGALVCTPKPQCNICCVQNLCVAYHRNQVAQLPYSSKKKEKKTRYLHYIVFVQNERYYFLRKRPNEDIWASLYDFYLIESDSELNRKRVGALLKKAQFPFVKGDVLQSTGPYTHLLTHQRLRVYFFRLAFQARPDVTLWLRQQGLKKMTYRRLGTLPKPVLIQKYLQKQKIFFNLTKK